MLTKEGIYMNIIYIYKHKYSFINILKLMKYLYNLFKLFFYLEKSQNIFLNK